MANYNRGLTRGISLQVRPELAKRAERLASKARLPKSEVYRRALEVGLPRVEAELSSRFRAQPKLKELGQ